MRRTFIHLSLLALAGCGGDGSAGGSRSDGGGPVDGGVDGSADASVAGLDGAADASDPGLDGSGDALVDRPVIRPGGGVGSGPVDGKLSVFVIDLYRGAPIAGAMVRVGAADAVAPLVGATDSDGLVVFEDRDLQGPQVVTAQVTDHVPATWFGVSGAVATIPLRPLDPVVPSATVSGTIEGWADIPVAPQNMLVATVWYSATADLSAPDNTIDQGMIARNVCFRVAPTDTCNWTLKTRTGKLAIFASLFESDPKGTPQLDDDEYFLLGYAFRRGYDLSAGEQVTGQVLLQLDGSDLVTPEATWDTPPPGQPFVTWTPVLRLGDEGQVPVVDQTGEGLRAPGLQGEIASASYAVLGSALPPVDTFPNSTTQAHDVDIVSEVDLGEWLPPASDLEASGGVYSFAPAADASLHLVDYSDFDEGTPLWSVALLDGSTSFRLPPLSPDPLEGNVAMTVRAYDVPGYTPMDFYWVWLLDGYERISADYILLP